MRFLIGLLRSITLRCPHCHKGRLLKNWFVVNEKCSECGYVYLKEPGDFWGGMVFSYTYAGVSALAAAAFTIEMGWLTWGQRVYVAAIAGALGVVLFHPYSRAHWITIMYLTRGQYEDYRAPEKRA